MHMYPFLVMDTILAKINIFILNISFFVKKRKNILDK